MKQARQFSSRWFRVYDEAVDDPKLQMLSDKAHRFLFNCWCMASKNGGYLPPIREIAWKLRMNEAKAASLLAELHEAGLLEREADTFTPHNWVCRQFGSDSSTQRVRAYRERKRNGDETLQKRHETVTETPSDTDTDTDTDQNREERNAPSGALSLVPFGNGSVVRPHVSTKRRNRSTEDIRKALGERLIWWESFWGVYPCHEGMNAAMDAFERKVNTRELAEQVYRGAKAYAQRCAAHPDLQVKYGQGWINGERWLDENRIRSPSPEPRQRSFMADVAEVIGQNIQETGKPW